MRLPSYNPITLGYGATTDPYTPANPHNGVDFGYLPDDSVYAPESGRVTLEWDNGSNADGNAVHLWAGNRHHALCHMSEFAVGEGAQVAEGQYLGRMGSTGFAQGKHCHWALKAGTQFINPLSLLTGGKGGGGQDDMVTDTDGEFQRWAIEFRLHVRQEPTREQFRAWVVGKSWLQAMIELQDGQAFQQVFPSLELGERAKAYHWEETLVELQKKADLSTELQKKVDACLAQQATDEANGTSFLRFLGRFFKGKK